MVTIWIELLKFVPSKTRQFVSWKMLDSIILNTAKTRRAIDRNLVHFNIKFDKSMFRKREKEKERESLPGLQSKPRLFTQRNTMTLALRKLTEILDCSHGLIVGKSKNYC